MRNIPLVSSEEMGRATQLDPQLRLPEKPCMSDAFQVIPLPDGMMVHGGENLQVLRGKAATQFLPQLVPLLNGQKTIEELSYLFPQYSLEAIRDVISLLYVRGLLEDGEGDAGIDLEEYEPEGLAFFRRHTDSTRVNRSAGEGLNRLKNTSILVLTDSQHGEGIQSELRHTGVSKVWLGSLDEEADVEDADFVMVFITGCPNHDVLSRIDQMCAKKGIPWMFSCVNGEKGVLGPYFEQGETACYQCFQNDYFGRETEDKNVAETPAEFIDMWEQYISIELAYFLSRIVPAATDLNYITFHFADWLKEDQRVTRRPGCPRCFPVAGMSSQPPDLVTRFEHAIAFPSKHLINPKSHQVHYKTSNITLTHESKTYPSALNTVLPDEANLPNVKGNFLDQLYNSDKQKSVESSLTLQSLSRVLLSGAGQRGAGDGKMSTNQKNQRWAPTGGNLGSVQIYVWVRSVADIPANLYYYQPNGHMLSRVGAKLSTADVEETIKRSIFLPGENLPGALVVLTGAYRRVASKYHAFAYRVIHLDAGVALAQMRAVSMGLGLEMRVQHHWNEQVIANDLDVNLLDEPITAAFVLSGKEEK
ncbi:SagB family peptide dehydrogenase [Bacillus sp. FSL W7-1360]